MVTYLGGGGEGTGKREAEERREKRHETGWTRRTRREGGTTKGETPRLDNSTTPDRDDCSMTVCAHARRLVERRLRAVGAVAAENDEIHAAVGLDVCGARQLRLVTHRIRTVEQGAERSKGGLELAHHLDRNRVLLRRARYSANDVDRAAHGGGTQRLLRVVGNAARADGLDVWRRRRALVADGEDVRKKELRNVVVVDAAHNARFLRTVENARGCGEDARQAVRRKAVSERHGDNIVGAPTQSKGAASGARRTRFGAAAWQAARGRAIWSEGDADWRAPTRRRRAE